jgi:hypothetical protein
MTLSTPLEQVLPPALDHPSDPPSPSPVLYDDGRRAGVDGPLSPVLA